MTQLSIIKKCFGNLYCRIQNDKCIGKDTAKNEHILDLLYIAYWVSCNDDCDISCFVKKYCASCDIPNALPVAVDTPDCCITGYASGAANISFVKVAGEWEAGFSLPTGTITNAVFDSYRYSWSFWQGGVEVDSGDSSDLTAPGSVSLPFRGDGMYQLAVQYIFDDGAVGFAVTKFVEVKGNLISKYVQVTSVLVNGYDCLTANLSGSYSASSNVTVLTEVWLQQLSNNDDFIAGFGSAIDYIVTEVDPVIMGYAVVLDQSQWPDYDFGSIPGPIGLLLLKTSCPPSSTPTLVLEFNYNCPLQRAEETLTFTNFATPTEIGFEYSTDGGTTWHSLDDSVTADGDGVATNDNVIGLPNGHYLLRAISDDDTIISNIVDYTINCEVPQISGLSATYNCSTNEITVEYDIASSLYTLLNVQFDFGSLFTFYQLGVTVPGHITYVYAIQPGDLPIANGTYSITATVGKTSDTSSTTAPIDISCGPPTTITLNSFNATCDSGVMLIDWNFTYADAQVPNNFAIQYFDGAGWITIISFGDTGLSDATTAGSDFSIASIFAGTHNVRVIELVSGAVSSTPFLFSSCP